MCLRQSYKKKIWGKIIFCILEVTEERSRIQSWIRVHQSEVRIRIRTKMSLIINITRYWYLVGITCIFLQVISQSLFLFQKREAGVPKAGFVRWISLHRPLLHLSPGQGALDLQAWGESLYGNVWDPDPHTSGTSSIECFLCYLYEMYIISNCFSSTYVRWQNLPDQHCCGIRIRTIRMFLGTRDPDPDTCIIKQKLKNNSLLNVLSTKHRKILFFVGVLKVNDENSRIRIHQSGARIRGS